MCQRLKQRTRCSPTSFRAPISWPAHQAALASSVTRLATAGFWSFVKSISCAPKRSILSKPAIYWLAEQHFWLDGFNILPLLFVLLPLLCCWCLCSQEYRYVWLDASKYSWVMEPANEFASLGYLTAKSKHGWSSNLTYLSETVGVCWTKLKIFLPTQIWHSNCLNQPQPLTFNFWPMHAHHDSKFADLHRWHSGSSFI